MVYLFWTAADVGLASAQEGKAVYASLEEAQARSAQRKDRFYGRVYQV